MRKAGRNVIIHKPNEKKTPEEDQKGRQGRKATTSKNKDASFAGGTTQMSLMVCSQGRREEDISLKESWKGGKKRKKTAQKTLAQCLHEKERRRRSRYILNDGKGQGGIRG